MYILAAICYVYLRFYLFVHIKVYNCLQMFLWDKILQYVCQLVFSFPWGNFNTFTSGSPYRHHLSPSNNDRRLLTNIECNKHSTDFHRQWHNFCDLHYNFTLQWIDCSIGPFKINAYCRNVIIFFAPSFLLMRRVRIFPYRSTCTCALKMM